MNDADPPLTKKPAMGVRAQGRISTTTFLEPEMRNRLVDVSRKMNESIPETVAKVLEIGLNIAENKAAVNRLPAAGSDVDVPIYKLSQAVRASRYPGDTGNARLQQIAVLLVIAHESSKGAQTTQTRLGQILDAERVVMGILANKLVKRGILGTALAPAIGGDGRKSGKSYFIRPDAIEAFIKHHKEETGIDLSEHVS